ncbi:MAG: hypothetical protein LC775_15860, partial [Acidobacteria bacterium]|nr:hypothetical protein [Acidobacteriota bacterium]
MFDLGPKVDYRALAQTLLNAGIAETVVSPTDGQVQVSRGYKDLAKLRKRLEIYRDAYQFLKSERTFRSLSIRAKLALVQSLIRTAVTNRLHSRRDIRNDEDQDVDSKRNLDERVSEVDERVQGARFVAALQYAVDNNLFNPRYLASEPYLRMELRPIRLGAFSSETMNFGDAEKLEHEVLLLLHRSGIAVVTIVVNLPATMSL